MNVFTIASVFFLMGSSAFCETGKYVEPDKETYVIHGLKDLEIQMNKAKPSLNYLIRKQNEVNQAIEVYGESSYQLSEGKHAQRYAKIRKESQELINYLKERSGTRTDLLSSTEKELKRICHSLSKKLVQMRVCFKNDDYIKKYKFFHKNSQLDFDSLLKDSVIKTVLNTVSGVNQKYSNLAEDEMRVQFEKDMPGIISEYIKKNKPNYDSLNIQMDMPYDLIGGLGTEFAQRDEEFTLDCINEIAKAPKILSKILVNELKNDKENFCPMNSTSSFTDSPEVAIEKALNSLGNLDAIKDVEEGAHTLMLDNGEEGKEFDALLQAEKKLNSKRTFK